MTHNSFACTCCIWLSCCTHLQQEKSLKILCENKIATHALSLEPWIQKTVLCQLFLILLHCLLSCVSLVRKAHLCSYFCSALLAYLYPFLHWCLKCLLSKPPCRKRKKAESREWNPFKKRRPPNVLHPFLILLCIWASLSLLSFRVYPLKTKPFLFTQQFSCL